MFSKAAAVREFTIYVITNGIRFPVILVNARAQRGKTALQVAKESGKHEIARLIAVRFIYVFISFAKQ